MQQLKTALLAALIMIGIIISPSLASAESGTEVVRISGSNRYETSLKLNGLIKSSNSAIIVNGENFPDSLSATTLAGNLNCPIYITENLGTLYSEFGRLGVWTVYIVGGHNSVSEELENTLSEDYKVVRIAGSNRYQTSDMVAAYCGLDTVAVASGRDFKPALVATNLLKTKNIALRLSDYDSELNYNIKYIIGDNEYLYPQKNTYVINSGDALLDGLRVLECVPHKPNLIIASERNFADALSAGGMLDVIGAHLLLVDGHEVESELIEKAKSYNKVYIVGGEKSISSQYESMLGKSTTSGNIVTHKQVEGFIWPVPSCGLISEYFIERFHPTRGTWEKHLGLDIPAGPGEQIVATKEGVVIQAGENGSYGNCVTIDHGDGIVSLYAHMTDVMAHVGQWVSAEEMIGTVGTTGLSTGSHLHFEIREYGVHVDPLKYIEFGK